MGTHPIFESDFDCLTDMEHDSPITSTGSIEPTKAEGDQGREIVYSENKIKYSRKNPLPLIEPHYQELLAQLDQKSVRTARFMNDKGWVNDDEGSVLIFLDNEKRETMMDMPRPNKPNKMKERRLTFEEMKELKAGDEPKCIWVIKSKDGKTPKYPVHVCHNSILSLTDQSSRLADENIESLTKPEIGILKKILQNPQ